MEMAGIASSVTKNKWNQKKFDESVERLFPYLEEQGLYGDPNLKAVEELLKANKLADAAEEFLNGFADQDGGEGNVDWGGLMDDVMAEFSNQVSLSNLK